MDELEDYLAEVDNTEETGIKRFSLTGNPATELMGYFFAKESVKTFDFDNAKMRLACPVLVPKKIPRNETENFPAHNIEFDEEALTKIFDDLMSNFKQGDLINVEHTDEIAPAFIREIWQVENPGKDRSYLEFGMLLKKGSIFAIIQFTNKNYFEDVVKEGKTGISIEGRFFPVKKEKQNEYKFKKVNVWQLKKAQSFTTLAAKSKTKTGNWKTAKRFPC